MSEAPTTAVEGLVRIGEMARRTGTTPRAIRYYEEIGLLMPRDGRGNGQHRVYGECEVAVLRDALRLKDLLGVTLDELKDLLAAEEARAAVRDEGQAVSNLAQRHGVVAGALRYVDRQLELVRRRRDEIMALEADLLDRRARMSGRLAGLDQR